MRLVDIDIVFIRWLRPLGFSVSIELEFVFVWVVNIDMISLQGIELGLISVQTLELTCFFVWVSKMTWFYCRDRYYLGFGVAASKLRCFYGGDRN